MSAAFTPSMTAADSVLWTIERDPELPVAAAALVDPGEHHHQEG
jgi:hypothetical protein